MDDRNSLGVYCEHLHRWWVLGENSAYGPYRTEAEAEKKLKEILDKPQAHGLG